MNIAIVQYNAGNIQSVLYALERIGVSALVTDNVEQIQKADKVIFPGVGEASTAMQYLRERKLDVVLQNLKQPVLGICLGMQLMCAHSEENDTTCLGIFDNEVKYFVPKISSIKVPQMGWNNITQLKTGLFQDIPENSYAYFVHGYYAELSKYTIATTQYIQEYSSALHRDNFMEFNFIPKNLRLLESKFYKTF